MYCQDSIVTVHFDENIFLDSIQLYINPQKKDENKARFKLRTVYTNPEQLEILQNLFEVCALEENGLELVTRRLPPFHDLVRDGIYPVNTIAPGDIILTPPVSIRDSLDSLTRKGFLHREDRYCIESSLLKIEKAIEFTSLLSSEISTAQKDIIVAMIDPYMEDINREMDDVEELKTWIRKLGFTERILADSLNPLKPRTARNLLRTWKRESSGKSDDFFESLLSIVKIYNGTANLETALLQNGTSLPSEETIMCIIEEKFESNRRDTEDTCDKKS